jgi:uncharacterized lipoprotein YmbA
LYVLTPLAEDTAAPSALPQRRLALGVGPVALPRYVDRPQIVTGRASHELQAAPFEQWAEPLRDNVVRVLATNLSLLLGTDRVAIFPWKSPGPMDYQVLVEVTHFLGDVGGDATLVALWSLVGKQGQDVLVSQKSVLRVSTTGPGYEALAAALSQLVANLSREIAASILTHASTASRP